MIPTLAAIRFTEPDRSRPLLLLGPSLGTSTVALWDVCAGYLTNRFDVVGWDLPGHGRSPGTTEPFSVPDLAAAVVSLTNKLLQDRGTPADRVSYAGVSLGGAVGLQLLLDHPDRFHAAVLICTGARISVPEQWNERAETVRKSGTPVLIEASARRWFAPGFLDGSPDVGAALLNSLHDADAGSYAFACEALAAFDVRHRLSEIRTPVLAVAGAHDPVTTVADLQIIADGVATGRLAVLDSASHLAPAEQPAEAAQLILEYLMTEQRSDADPTVRQVYDAGMVVRRQVLGDAHVDRATAAATDLTREFQEFITRYAWGTIWTRPGLDRRSRSLVTLTALIARGHHEELAMHVRAARTNGLSNDEIKEVILQTAIYCGVPDANTAFRIASKVLNDLDDAGNVEPGRSAFTESEEQ
jgi:3-oxoadipate enol-lactonase / 4-carboxymuconolactone decarboxylase